MKTTVTLKPEKTYTVTINGKESPGWVEDSRWHGMMALKKDGQTIICEAPAAFSELGTDVLGIDPPEVSVVSASPSILAEMHKDGSDLPEQGD